MSSESAAVTETSTKPSDAIARYLHQSLEEVAENLSLRLRGTEPKAEKAVEAVPPPTAPAFRQPFSRNQKFVGRSQILGQLFTLWKPWKKGRIAICGLGGIGKTEVVLEFTYRLRGISPTTPIFWFAPEDLASSSDSEASSSSSHLDQWLKEDHGAECLLIVDPGDNFSVLEEPNERGKLIDRLRLFNGTLIVIARSRQNGGLLASPRNICEIHDLERELAVSLLRDRLAFDAFEMSSQHQLREIVEHVVCIPRAILQVADIINNIGMQVHQFLDMYQTDDQMKLQLFGTLDPLWKVSDTDSATGKGIIDLKGFQDAYSIAVRTLYQLYFLGGILVPRSLISAVTNPLELVIVMSILKGHFLVKEDLVHRVLNIHPMVYLAISKLLQNEEQRPSELSEWKAEISNAFSAQYPDYDSDDRDWWRNCFSDSFSGYETNEDPLRCAMAAIRDKESRYLLRKGLYADALTMASAAEEALPSPIPDAYLCIAQNHLMLLELLGKYRELRDKLQSYPGEHGDPLWKARLDARLCQAEGAYDAAIEKFRQIKTARESANAAPADLYRSKEDLAVALMHKGKLQEAELECRSAFRNRSDQLGPNHQDTLVSAHNLAQILKNCGKFEEALRFIQEAIHGGGLVFGEDRPVMAHSWIVKAEILFGMAVTQTQYADVEALLAKAAAKLRGSLSENPPDVLTCNSDQALVLLAQEKYSAAVDQNRLVLEARKQGPWLEPAKHPDTLTSRHQLAVCLRQKFGCRVQGCITLSEQVLIERTQLLTNRTAEGDDFHPDQLASLHHQAIVLSGQDQASSALEKIKIALRGREAIPGSTHPDTFITLAWLEEIMRTQLPQKERSHTLDIIDALHQKAVDGLTLIFGLEHHSTLECKSHMAAARRERGSTQGFKDAELLYRQIWNAYRRMRGDEHPESLRAKTRLADVMHLLGAPQEDTKKMWREACAGWRWFVGLSRMIL